MAFSTHEFKLDLTPGASRPVLYASQGDIGRPFMARCYWNGATWNADAYTVNIRGRKPDETVFDYTATVDGSKVTFETTEQMTIISGPVECELVFSNDGDIIASANFVLMVEGSPYNPDALSESDIPTIGDLIEDTIGGDIRDEVDALIEENPELMLQDNSVTTPKLAAGAVTEGKIASNAVTTGKLATGAVTYAKLDDSLKAYVTPEMFGAVGDGTTDDTAAVQAAVNSGKTVIAKNKYKLKSAISINTPIKIYGGEYIAAHSGNMFVISANGCGLYGATFDGGEVAGIAVKCLNCEFVELAELEIKNIYNTGGGSSNESTGVLISGSKYIVVRDCNIHDIKNTSQYTNVSRGVSCLNSENVAIFRNYIDNITATASGSFDANAIECIYENRATGENNIKIFNNTFGYTTKRIVKIQQYGVTIEGNCFEYRDSETTDQAVAVFHSNVVIKGNDFKTHAPTMIRIGDTNSDVDFVKDVFVLDNTFYTTATRYQGVVNLTEHIENIEICRNTFNSASTTETGVSFRGGTNSNNVVISENTFSGFAQCVGSMQNSTLSNVCITSNVGEAIYTFVLFNDNSTVTAVLVVGNIYKNNTTPPSGYLYYLVVYRQAAVNDFVVASNIKPSTYGDHSPVST